MISSELVDLCTRYALSDTRPLTKPCTEPDLTVPSASEFHRGTVDGKKTTVGNNLHGREREEMT